MSTHFEITSLKTNEEISKERRENPLFVECHSSFWREESFDLKRFNRHDLALFYDHTIRYSFFICPYFFLSISSSPHPSHLFFFLSFSSFPSENKAKEQTTASSCLVDESTAVGDSLQWAKRQGKQMPVRLQERLSFHRSNNVCLVSILPRPRGRSLMAPQKQKQQAPGACLVALHPLSFRRWRMIEPYVG